MLEICSMMLLLDCSNPIIVHSMAFKHGALTHQIINAFVYLGTRVFETFYDYHILRIPGFLGHCCDSLIFIVNCNNAPYDFCVQYRITTILWFLLVENMQITMQIHHLVITLHILEIVTVLTFSLMYVLKKLFTLHD